MSQEKIALLRAYGAEVVICPTAVDADSPESYYSVSDRFAEEIPGAFKPDQYSNMANPDAHYEVTGPEIWEQTGGEIDAFVVSVGTGGTISGAGRYLKERNPDILIVGADPEGSVYTALEETDIHPYLVEGIGKDTWPRTMAKDVVDEWIRVSDRDSFLVARRLAREEGLLAGGSGGTSVWAMLEIADRFGAEAKILTMIPDSGRNYLSKFYDDNWMLDHGFLERRAPAPTVEQVLRSKQTEEPDIPDLVTIAANQKVGAAIDLMQRYSISQLPVIRDGEVESLADVIGSLQDRDLLDRVFKNPDALHEDVVAAMQPPLAAIDAGEPLDEVFSTLSGRTNAVVVAQAAGLSASLPAQTCSSTWRTTASCESRSSQTSTETRSRSTRFSPTSTSSGSMRWSASGDHAQGGPQPAECLERLRDLECPAVMGNSDDFLLTLTPATSP